VEVKNGVPEREGERESKKKKGRTEKEKRKIEEIAKE
jgi:hypothetical protein